MADVFISYASADQRLAELVRAELQSHGVSAFHATADLQPGHEWSDAIWRNLHTSTWVLFLGSAVACQSPYVQQELGGALHGRKEVVPVVWDIDPSNLPGWTNRYQALDLRGRAIGDLKVQIASIADRIKAKKPQGYLIAGALVVGLLLLASGE